MENNKIELLSNNEVCTITTSVDREEFNKVKQWLEELFEKHSISTTKAKKQMLIAADEIFTNICNYAYADSDNESSNIKIDFSYNQENKLISLAFTDSGVAYNPLLEDPPDIAKRIKERTVGGLGIFMVTKMMTSIDYKRENNQNILTLKKAVQ